MAIKDSNSTVTELLTKRIAATKKYFTDPTIAIPIEGKQCHPADVVAIFQDDVDARAAVDTAHASVTATITTRKTADAKRRNADLALKSYVTHLYGPTSTEAQEFGYPAPKPRAKTVAAKSTAIQKSAATRAARGTKGSVQKALISGTTEVYSSPAAAAAAAQHVPAPAAGAPVVAQPAEPAAAPQAAAAPVATPVVNGTNGAGH